MKYLIIVGLGILTSFYFFPVSFTFLPLALNSKIMIGVLGIAMFLFNGLRVRAVKLSRELVGAAALAALFSFLCLLSCEINNTDDSSYSTYIFSFFTWLMGAYGVCELIRLYHGKATMQILVFYLAAICAFQSIIAQVIDQVPAVQRFVDSIFYIDKSFFEEIDRLYGIGAALDPAGVRFAVVLVLMVYLMQKVRLSTFTNYLLWGGFIVVVMLGSMISRTTLVGSGLALGYLLFGSLMLPKREGIEYTRIYVPLFMLLLVAIGLGVFYYQTNENFHANLRFAFEGFFNWVEQGEWRTDSTDKLNNVMWIWPQDVKSWIWGTGLFDGFIYSTDIGYCRFILYCGLMGFSTFVLFFAYNSWATCSLKKIDWTLALLLFGLTLVIWVKVATDIFVIYALFYCMEPDDDNPETELEVKEDVL